jgi:hypothetical protein
VKYGSTVSHTSCDLEKVLEKPSHEPQNRKTAGRRTSRRSHELKSAEQDGAGNPYERRGFVLEIVD